MDQAQQFSVKLIDYAITWFSTRPPSTWLNLLFFLGIVAGVIAVTAWKRKKFFRETAEKLSTKLTLLNVWVWSALAGATQWAIDSIANGSQLLGPFIPKEYLAHVTEISVAAVAAHAIATGLLKAWTKHKAKQAGLPETIQTSIRVAASHIPATTPDVHTIKPQKEAGAPVTSDIWTR